MAEAAPAGAATAPADKLDDLMLAMDVVDTLRHQDGLIEKELAQDDRDAALKDRLRRLYVSQGLTVDDRILDEGIRALKEARFTYTPAPPGPSRSLAMLWVRRRTAGVVVAIGLAAIVAAGGWLAWSSGAQRRAADAARIEISETLPRQLSVAMDAVTSESKDPRATAAAAALQADGEAALAKGDAAGVRAAIAGLEDLRARLVRQYQLVIVSRPGERTGVFRVPDANSSARNYYVVVEALDPAGRAIALPVTSEEDGKTVTVETWGVRVPKATYDAVARDKGDDGIVENKVLADKTRGVLDPVYRMDVLGGAIVSW